jgi:hypothetical protein
MTHKTALVLALLTAASLAGESSREVIDAHSEESPSDAWLTIAPYGWITATNGDMGVAGRVAPVDISMQDTLDELEIAFMLAVEGGFGRWAFGLDGIYAGSSSSATLPAVAAPYTDATVDFDQFFGRIHAGYRVIDECGSTLTAFVGARYSYLSTEIALTGFGAPTLAADGSKSWIDPVIGLHGVWEINDRWFLHGGGDIGGFGVNSDLIWQANAALGYRFQENLSLLIGYRGFGVDYSEGGFLVDTVAHGPVSE